MVLPVTLTIQDRSVRVLTTVCISSNNSPERQVNYIQSNQPFVEGPSKEHFSAAQCNLMLWAASTGPAEELLQTKYLRGLIRELLLWAVKMFDASDLAMGGRVQY